MLMRHRETMVQNVQMHIKSLNFGYRAQLMTEKVKYYNGYAVFTGPNSLELTDKKGKVVSDITLRLWVHRFTL